MRRTAAAAAALLVAAASASDFENWNPNERDPDGKTDLAVVVMWPLLSQHRKRVANEAGEYEYEGVAQAPSKKQ